MFIKTLTKRSQNKNSRNMGNFYGMIGLFNSADTSLKVIVCPENESLEGKTFPIEASKKNIANAIEYANKQTENSENKEVKEYFTAIDRMRRSAEMARAMQTKKAPTPQMLFYLPSVYMSGEKIIVNINPFSCRTPEFEGNENIKSPVYGYAPAEVFIINVQREVTSAKSKKNFDYVNYFVCKKHPLIHEGYLNDPALGEALAQEVIKNPLLDDFTGSHKPTENAQLNNENALESIKYQICLKNHPEIVLYGNVVTLYDFQSRKMFRTADEILERLRSNIAYVLKNDDSSNPELDEFIKNNVFVRCISGFRVHEGFFDSNGQMKDMRLKTPLVEHCSYLQAFDEKNKNNVTCVPPLKRIPDEARKHLYSVRALALANPNSKSVSYPLGQGLVLIKERINKETEQTYDILSLEAGFLNHNAESLTTRFFMDGTKIDLSDRGILREEILPILKIEDIDKAATHCRELYEQLIDSVEIEDGNEEENIADANMDEVEPSESSEEQLPY